MIPVPVRPSVTVVPETETIELTVVPATPFSVKSLADTALSDTAWSTVNAISVVELVVPLTKFGESASIAGADPDDGVVVNAEFVLLEPSVNCTLIGIVEESDIEVSPSEIT